MRSNLFASGLAIVLGLAGVSAIGFPEVAIAQSIEGRKAEANKLVKQGIQQYQTSQFNIALQSWQRAMLIYREIKDLRSEGRTLSKLGVAYDSLGNYYKAIDYHKQSLEIALDIKDRLGEGYALSYLGSSYYSIGNYARAIDSHEQSLVIAIELKDRSSEGKALGNLGIAYRTLGNYAKAIEYLEKSLVIKREINDRIGEGQSLGSLGNTYDSLGNYIEAIKYHKRHLEISREVNDKLGEEQSLNNLGLAYYSIGDYAKAIDYHERSLVISREIQNRIGEGSSMSGLGLAHDSIGSYVKAIDYHKQSLMVAREIKDQNGERSSLNNIGFTLKNQKKIVLAIAFYKQSVNISESLRKNIRKLPREAQEVYTSSIASTYRDLADLLLTQGRIREAQSILELLKVQEASGYGQAQEASSSIVQFPLHPLESQALQVVEKTIASKQPLTLESLDTIAQPLTQNRDRITQDMNNLPIAIGNPQALLKANPNALLIQNLVVNDKLWVLWTNASGNTKAIVVPNVTQKQLDETVKTFRQQVGTHTSNLNALKATSTQLYNWLIPTELQTELKNNPKQQLLFSLDHVTRYIPIAALYDGKDYLAQRHTLSNLITTDTDTIDRLSLNGQPPTILGLGTTKLYTGFSALPNVEAELNAIVKDNANLGLYPGKIQLNEAFTATSLTQNLDNYRVLHIATHGSFNPKSITASFLLLGNGEKLPITSIASLTNLNTTHLVVLSACETGLSGVGQDGTEISGISGYFLRRGAKSVLASLWSVNDASTALLMQQFYKTLSETKLTKAEALQKVQQDFISGKFTTKEAADIRGVRVFIEGQAPPDSFAHPYFWAPFTLTGNSN